MTPAARVQAAITCLDAIFSGAPAEKTLTTWARRSRFAGSKDRAAVRDHVFDVLRRRDSLATAGGAMTGRAVMIALIAKQDGACDAIFSGQGYAPEGLSEHEQDLVTQILTNDGEGQDFIWDMPIWCAQKIEAAYGGTARQIADELRSRAPVDLRVNIRKTTIDKAILALEAEGILVTPVTHAPWALRITQGSRRLRGSAAYMTGLVELQDAGSQALVAALPLSAGMRVLDLCAGGGGKSLAMAASENIQSFAYDINAKRMGDIPERARRANVQITCLTKEQLACSAPFDLVLCDVPCSGSGAWRRSPDAKWRLSQSDFDELLATQSSILASAPGFLAPNGSLAYTTCSLFADENEDQVNAFLKDHANFKVIKQKSWTPLDGCDGFHLSLLA